MADPSQSKRPIMRRDILPTVMQSSRAQPRYEHGIVQQQPNSHFYLWAHLLYNLY